MNEQFDESSAAPSVVELVVLIDTSGSMERDAQAISNAAEEALKVVKEKCCEVKVHWFGIAGKYEGTNFTMSLRDYLTNDNKGQRIDDSDLASRLDEDGAYAIKDIADHFNWTPGASRAILFLGDEELFGGNYFPDPRRYGTPQQPMDIIAANRAIDAATRHEHEVSVSMYAASKAGNIPSTEHELMIKEYRRVARETGGQFNEIGRSKCSIDEELAKLELAEFVKALRRQDLGKVSKAILDSGGPALSSGAVIKRRIESNWNAPAPNMKFWWIKDGRKPYTVEVEYTDDTGEEIKKIEVHYADRPTEEQIHELLKEVICSKCPRGHTTDLVMVIYATDAMAEEDAGPEDLWRDCLGATNKNQEEHGADTLRVEWLGIEGGWESRLVGDRMIDTDFWPSYRSYLVDSPKTVINDREDDRLVGIRRERGAGAAAITDLSNYFDWRPGAAKYIFLFGRLLNNSG